MITMLNKIRGVGISNPLFDNRKCEPFSLGAAAIIGGGSLLGSAFSGLFGSSAQSKANATNLQLAREQMQYNKEEAERNRKWQEYMYGLSYDRSTALAQAAQMRAAGLNPQLGSIQAGQGQSFNGAQASYDNIPIQQPVNAMANALGDMMPTAASTAGEFAQQISQSKLNEAKANEVTVNADNIKAMTDLVKKNTERADVELDTIKRMKEALIDTAHWNERSAFYQSLWHDYHQQNEYWLTKQNKYTYWHIMPLQSQLYQSQLDVNAANIFELMQRGNLSLQQAEDLILTRAPRIANLVAGTYNLYATGRGALMQGEAAKQNADTNQQELQYKKDSKLYENQSYMYKQSGYNQNAQGNLARFNKWKGQYLLPWVKQDLIEQVDYLKSQKWRNYFSIGKEALMTPSEMMRNVGQGASGAASAIAR